MKTRKNLPIKNQENSDGYNVLHEIIVDHWEQTIYGGDMPKYLENIVGKCMPEYLGALDDPTVNGYWIILHKDESFTVRLHRDSDQPQLDHQPPAAPCKKKTKES